MLKLFISRVVYTLEQMAVVQMALSSSKCNATSLDTAVHSADMNQMFIRVWLSGMPWQLNSSPNRLHPALYGIEPSCIELVAYHIISILYVIIIVFASLLLLLAVSLYDARHH